jgi:HD superfamily phosphodiesterase
MSDWLTQLKTDLKEITLPDARKFWPGVTPEDEPYYNYRYQHVAQVEKEARKLLAVYGGDEDIVLASIWLHDRCQSVHDRDNHAVLASKWAKNHLAGTGFPVKKVPSVMHAVANHRNPPHTIPEEYKEARILWDADRLTKIGVTMIVYTLCSNGAYPQTKVDFDWVKINSRRWLERVKNLPNDYYFPLSRELGRKRWNAEKAFCDALDEETGN